VNPFSRIAAGIDRGSPVTIVVDGAPMQAFRGESIATVLLVNGRRTLRWTPRGHEPRSVFCAMGVCFDCVVTVNGQPNVRSCMVSADADMIVETGVADGR